ncbi:hypothetical protein LRS13_09510 [Svornostia abyssi]|uniref:Uncharacterized protein n=1 Tax=Svornostia abyssi TaxID=2898438 RepID=A0ABY5PM63_9ACTN|nr:hypothetical protein LRS13_09510 [Parviterribacteraceae bacterium J379]
MLTNEAVTECQSQLLAAGLVKTRINYIARQILEVTVSVKRSPTVRLTGATGVVYAYACAELLHFRVGLDVVDTSNASVGTLTPVTGTKFALQGIPLPTKKQDALRHTRALILPAPVTKAAATSGVFAVRVQVTAPANRKTLAGLNPELDTLGIPDRSVQVLKTIGPRALRATRVRRGDQRRELRSEEVKQLFRRCPPDRDDQVTSASINLGTASGAIDDRSRLVTARAEWYGAEGKNDPHPGGVDYIYRLHRGTELCAALAFTDETSGAPQVLTRLVPTLSTPSWGYLHDRTGKFGQVMFLLKR